MCSDIQNPAAGQLAADLCLSSGPHWAARYQRTRRSVKFYTYYATTTMKIQRGFCPCPYCAFLLWTESTDSAVQFAELFLVSIPASCLSVWGCTAPSRKLKILGRSQRVSVRPSPRCFLPSSDISERQQCLLERTKKTPPFIVFRTLNLQLFRTSSLNES